MNHFQLILSILKYNRINENFIQRPRFVNSKIKYNLCLKERSFFEQYFDPLKVCIYHERMILYLQNNNKNCICDVLSYLHEWVNEENAFFSLSTTMPIGRIATANQNSIELILYSCCSLRILSTKRFFFVSCFQFVVKANRKEKKLASTETHRQHRTNHIHTLNDKLNEDKWK